METRNGWLSPLVHLSNNWISFLGVLIVTTTVVFWLFLLPTTLKGDVANPYIGILAFMGIPALFFLGLGLIPLGIWFRKRREVKHGLYPASFPKLDFKNTDFRRLVTFVGAATFVNIVIASQLTYGAVTYMESVTFCGQTCHTVMQPEYTAYQNSPHSRVECVKCHIGPGASWFVKSKLSGSWQVISVALNLYPRPIPTPVHNLRPARDTCEGCHWPQKYGGDRLRVVRKFADDETNTESKTVLLMKIGGGGVGPGIHGFHLGEGVRIRYRHSDEKRQTIPWVEYDDGKSKTVYTAGEGNFDKLPMREMDCMDCHTRPSHSMDLPERAFDNALAAGAISLKLPFVKKQGVDILKKDYPTREQAQREIPAALAKFYQEKYPQVWQAQRQDVETAGKAALAIWERNIFPEMKVTWGTYPNHIGHTDFPGCFRCHDDNHAAKNGRKVSQDCNACHNLLAMDEPAPKILGELGVTQD